MLGWAALASACTDQAKPSIPSPEALGGAAGEGEPAGGAGGAGGSDLDVVAGAGAEAADAGAGGGGYTDPEGACTPGVPRCHGDFGYQSCQQDGSWSESHSCAGYSVNGTSSYCVEIPTEEGGAAWGTCVDPACWFWLTRGFLPGDTPVGACLPDGRLDRCGNGGTLKEEECAGVCTQVGMLDGRALGFCAPACASGARECVGARLYRECVDGRWSEDARACPADAACNPLAEGDIPDIRCGGPCDPGTTRCTADGGAVEVCSEAGAWEPDRVCLLGRCLPAGPQAECQAECAEGQHACAWDGAASERVCGATGLWGAELPCAEGASCRLSGTAALGCVACVGPSAPAGNAFHVADSRCDDAGLVSCGPDGTWQAAVPCAEGSACAEVAQAPSSAAACAEL